MMVAYVFAEQCLMEKQFHAVMRIAHMAFKIHKNGSKSDIFFENVL